MTPERARKLDEVINKRQNGLTVVMENVHDPHNIYAVMRTCDAVGIQDIYVLNTELPKDGYFGIKSSSSANKWLTIHSFNNVKDCFAELRTKYQSIYTTYLGESSKSVYDINFTNSIALVFGNEHKGVSKEARDLADGNFIIPQVGMIPSLNISVACAVAIYEAFRQRKVAGLYDQNAQPHPAAAEIKSLWASFSAS
ncbi:RNA methyltransferase [Sediminibacterium sp.]|uniref:TrmH family RNA methyltransferase n=1 Tax=Sediminibacterium sp. TaxID=1917865 RepID=UPI002735928A|nr:RNA methyltransferase [Sediminibacterium sp.]MDP3394187.1 RNA methyltransferase [Sediminibacterium sp.]MDP3566224.1 RNA methyltransferase [Sediminibacterium sp.]